LRLALLVRALWRFRPHVVQAAHFYVNLYAAAAAKACGALSIGSIRSDGVKDLRDAGFWGRWQLRSPRMLIVNSRAARLHAVRKGIEASAVHVIAGVLDAPTALEGRVRQPHRPDGAVVAVAVASLIADKRLERFLGALANARRSVPGLRGMIAGNGPDRRRLESIAATLGLTPEAICFTGHYADVSAFLRSADMLILTSDHEGCPNAILEAMAVGLPVVTTPAGDAAWLVGDGVAGFVVDFDDVDGLAERMIRLAQAPELRVRLGAAGRERVLRDFCPDALAAQLFSAYRAGARRVGRRVLLDYLDSAGLEDDVDAELSAG
jgi:glycosyltransferase involved in cell wall biosynthesis